MDLSHLKILGSFLQGLKSYNFSLYGKWVAYLNIVLCIAFGIANLFHVNAVVAFGAISIAQGAIVLFLEVPFLLRICPLSNNFIEFVSRFETNGWRTIFYICNAVLQWVSLALKITSLIVVAVGLTISAAFYGVAYFKRQNFQNSSHIKEPVGESAVDNGQNVREML
ncbi:Golgi apparatus membrane protein tvp18 [Zygosaccharomyces mellis]|uniref:Golgi apparatus membrane protein TVP18 n=1 Tax=Zygosaccharomyces mellis TaxID=42258 RepID=A0A4C2E8E8_9SACH|nr:Golgi apparatus membrane protein tvp18 [Zygosaccharomyces mellis]